MLKSHQQNARQNQFPILIKCISMASLCGKMNTVQHHVKFNQSIEKQGKFK